MKIKYYKQETSYTCGAAALRMALGALGIKKTEKQLAGLLKTNKTRGTWFKYFPIAAEKYKLNYIVARNSSIKDLKNAISKGYIIIIGYNPFSGYMGHYALLKKIKNNSIYFYDPGFGNGQSYKLGHFMKIWEMPAEKEKKSFIGIKRNDKDA